MEAWLKGLGRKPHVTVFFLTGHVGKGECVGGKLDSVGSNHLVLNPMDDGGTAGIPFSAIGYVRPG